MENDKNENEKLDALCKECGHAFKTYVDRLISDEIRTDESNPLTCPVCGCEECHIGK
ncbi:MAG: hypothetical protein JSW39_29010 [Desulfobacterales bacterium]|nr:MAG: hypothetical protein JSW39_29010 [Desulfobacterales bacterium]